MSSPMMWNVINADEPTTSYKRKDDEHGFTSSNLFHVATFFQIKLQPPTRKAVSAGMWTLYWCKMFLIYGNNTDYENYNKY